MKKILALAFLTFNLSFVHQSLATDFYWNVSSGNFGTNTNWRTDGYGGSVTPGSAPGSGDVVHIGKNSNQTLTLEANYTITDLYLEGTAQIFINGSGKTLTVTGNVDAHGNSNSTGGGSAIIKFAGTGSQTLTGQSSSSDIGKGKLPNILVDNSGYTLSLAGYITIGGSASFTYTSGTISYGTSTIIFYHNNTVTGTFGLNDVEFQGNSSTHVISNTLTVNGNLKLSGSSSCILNTGTIELYGNLDDENTASNSGGTGTIAFKGGNLQTYKYTSGPLCNIIVDKSADSLKPASGTTKMNVKGRLTISGGTFMAPSGILSISQTATGGSHTLFDNSAGTFLHNNGTVKLAGPGNNTTYIVDVLSTTLFYDVIDSILISGNRPDLTSASGDTVKIANNFTCKGSNNLLGYWKVEGNYNVSVGGAGGSSGKVILTGSNSVTYSYTGSGKGAVLEINKTSGSVTPATGTTDMSISGLLLVNGSFTAPSGTLFIGQNLTSSGSVTLFSHSGGTFSHNSGTVKFDGSGNNTVFIVDVLSSTLFYNVTDSIRIVNNRPDLTSASGDTVKIVNNFIYRDNNNLLGYWKVEGNYIQATGGTSGTSGKVILAGSNSVTYSYTGSGKGAVLEINKTSGSVTPASGTTTMNLSGLFVVSGSFTAPGGILFIGQNTTSSGSITLFSHSGGTFSHNSGTVKFDGKGNNTTFIVDVLTSTLFNNVVDSVEANNNRPDLTSASGDTVKIADSFTKYGYSELNGIWSVNGNVIVNTSLYGGTAEIIISGTADKTITVGSSITLNKLTVNKSSGKLTLGSDLTLTNSLVLANGIIDGNGYLTTLNSGATVTGASDNSFVSGTIKKIGNAAFTFPTGKGTEYHPIAITAPSSATDAFTAEYFDSPNDTIDKDTSLTYFSACEYWHLYRTTGTSNVKVKLYWNSNTCDIYTLSTLKIARLESGTWKSIGACTAIGNTTSGRDSSNSAQSTFGSFTIGKRSSQVYAHAGSDLILCGGNDISIGTTPAATGGTTSYSYSWSPGADLSSSTEANPTASPTATTTYILTVTDADNCVGRDTMVVTVHESPLVNAGRDTSICLGQSVLIGNTASGGTSPYTYAWTPGTSLDDSTIAQPTTTPDSTVGYLITVTDDNGCQGSDSVTVIVYHIVADAGEDRIQCQGSSVIIGAGNTGSGGYFPYDYVWTNFANDTLFQEPNPSIAADSSLSFIVEITDALGCMGRDTMSFTVNPALTLSLTHTVYLSMGDTVILGGSPTVTGGTSPYHFEWSPALWLDDSTSANPVAKPKSSAFYHLFVSDTAGCYTQGDVELYFSPVDFGVLDNYSLFSADSIIVTDTATVEGIAGAVSFVSSKVNSYAEVQTGGAAVSDALSDYNSAMSAIDNMAADTISATLPSTFSVPGVYRIIGNVTLDHNLTFSGNDSSFYILDITGDLTIDNDVSVVSDNVDMSNIIIRSRGDMSMGANITADGIFLADGNMIGQNIEINGALRTRGDRLEYSLIVAIVPIVIAVKLPPNMPTFHLINEDYFGINTESAVEDYFPSDPDNTGGSFTDINFRKLIPGLNVKLLRLRCGRDKVYDWNSGWWKAPNYLRYAPFYTGPTPATAPYPPLNSPQYTPSVIPFPYLDKFYAKPDLTDYALPTVGNPHYIIENRPEHHRLVANGINAGLMLTLDVLNSNKDYELQWIDYTKDLGIQAKYVELGNEIYSGGNNVSNKLYPSSNRLITVANEFLDDIHTNYNNEIKVGIPIPNVGYEDPLETDDGDDNDNEKPYDCRASTWGAALNLPQTTADLGNDDLLHLKDGDGLIIHLYPNSNLKNAYTNGIIINGTGDMGEQDIRENMFTYPFESMRNFKLNIVPLLPPGINAWITEFNLSEHRKDRAAHGTWAHGLFQSSLILSMLEEKRISIITPHTYLSDASHGLFFDNDGRFIKLTGLFKDPGNSSNKITPIPWNKTASGHCVTLLGKAFDGAEAVVQMNFNKLIGTVPKLNPALPYSSLYGWLFLNTSPEKNEAIILNLGNTAQTVNVQNIIIPSGTYNGGSSAPFSGVVFRGEAHCINSEQYSCADPTVYVRGNEGNSDQNGKATVKFTNLGEKVPQKDTKDLIYTPSSGSIINLPAYSITRVYMRGLSGITVTANQEKVCENDAVSFKAEGANYVTWRAFDEDGNSDNAIISYDHQLQASVTVTFKKAGTYSVSAVAPNRGCNGNLLSPETISDEVEVEVVAAPTMVITSANDPYCSGNVAVTLSATVSGGTISAFWWSPTEGLYETAAITSLPHINGTTTGSDNTIYARPLVPKGKFAIKNREDMARYYARAVVTVDDDITCVAQGSIDVKIKDVLKTNSTNPHYKIRYKSVDNGEQDDNVTLCKDDAAKAFTLCVVNKNNKNTQECYLIPVTYYINGDYEHPMLKTDGIFSFPSGSLLHSTSFLAEFEDGGCRHIVAFDYTVFPETELETPKLEACTNEYLKLKVDGADAKYTNLGVTDNVSGIYSWTPNDQHYFYVYDKETELFEEVNPVESKKSVYFKTGTAGSYAVTAKAKTGQPIDGLCDNQENSSSFNIQVYAAPDDDGYEYLSCTEDDLLEITPAGTSGDFVQWKIISGGLFDPSTGQPSLVGNSLNAIIPGKYEVYSVYNNLSLYGNFGCCVKYTIDVSNYECRNEEKENNELKKKVIPFLSIYPNPNEGKFIVEISNPSVADEAAELSIVNLMGQRIFYGKYPVSKGERFRKNISIPQQGQYILVIKIGSEFYRSSIVSLKN